MLCFQDCVDMCDLAPDDEHAIRDRLTLAEIGEALAACPKRDKAGDVDCVVLHHVRIAKTPVHAEACAFTYRAHPAVSQTRHC